MQIMNGKRGLIMGLANNHSIAWGIAQTLHAHGAELAFTYQGEAFEKRVRPLAAQLNAAVLGDCDVSDNASVLRIVDQLHKLWPEGIDFYVHAIAYSDKNELKGRYSDTTRDNFLRTMDISCLSFTDIIRCLLPHAKPHASFLTLSYLGAERVIPNYNVMGVAKAALEASVRYLAADVGPEGFRVNAISAGPMRTLAGSAIGSARVTYAFHQKSAPLRRTTTPEEIGGAALFLLSSLGGGVTGEVLHVDGGYHCIGIPQLSDEGEG